MMLFDASSTAWAVWRRIVTGLWTIKWKDWEGVVAKTLFQVLPQILPKLTKKNYGNPSQASRYLRPNSNLASNEQEPEAV
jgi:hypothetical protein